MRWCAAALAALALAACGHEATKKGTGVPIDTAAGMPTLDTATRPPDTTGLAAPAESTLATLGTPATGAPSVVLIADSAAGDTIFHRRGRCFTCHGATGAGAPRLGPNLTDSLWLNGNGSLDSIRAIIANGIATPKAFPVAMPAYNSMLSPEQIAQVAAYVYTLSHRGAAVADTTHPDSTTRHDTSHVHPPT